MFIIIMYSHEDRRVIASSIKRIYRRDWFSILNVIVFGYIFGMFLGFVMRINFD